MTSTRWMAAFSIMRSTLGPDAAHIGRIATDRVTGRLLIGTVRSFVARSRRRIGNLPAEATSFVGRRRELAELRRTLAGARLVSLVGPGGVGKTRLAVRMATDLERGFADGAWWVELAEIRDPALVTNAVVAALDLRDQAATQPLQILLSHLRDSELLLVLDNCEHVLEAVRPPGGRRPSRCARRAGDDHDPGAAPGAGGARCPRAAARASSGRRRRTARPASAERSRCCCSPSARPPHRGRSS